MQTRLTPTGRRVRNVSLKFVGNAILYSVMITGGVVIIRAATPSILQWWREASATRPLPTVMATRSGAVPVPAPAPTPVPSSRLPFGSSTDLSLQQRPTPSTPRDRPVYEPPRSVYVPNPVYLPPPRTQTREYHLRWQWPGKRDARDRVGTRSERRRDESKRKSASEKHRPQDRAGKQGQSEPRPKTPPGAKTPPPPQKPGANIGGKRK